LDQAAFLLLLWPVVKKVEIIVPL